MDIRNKTATKRPSRPTDAWNKDGEKDFETAGKKRSASSSIDAEEPNEDLDQVASRSFQPVPSTAVPESPEGKMKLRPIYVWISLLTILVFGWI